MCTLCMYVWYFYVRVCGKKKRACEQGVVTEHTTGFVTPTVLYSLY